MHTVIELKTRDSTLKIGTLESPVRPIGDHTHTVSWHTAVHVP